MFCPRCGSILMPKKIDGTTVISCSCGYSSVGGDIKIKEKFKEEKELEIVDEEFESLPLTDEKCPKCGHRKAYFWTKQTRAADEPETKFLKCEKCKHHWRDYN